MRKLIEHDLDKVIDLLTARLSCERSGVKIYEAIIAKMRHSSVPGIARMMTAMEEHRDQEMEHQEWLEEQIRTLGGDAHGTSDMALLEHREAKGIEEICLDGDNDMTHLFHALLAAELSDHAGWDLLVQLADAAHDRAAKREFKRRRHEEAEHLLFARRAVAAFARRSVLGEDRDLPMSP